MLDYMNFSEKKRSWRHKIGTTVINFIQSFELCIEVRKLRVGARKFREERICQIYGLDLNVSRDSLRSSDSYL